MKAEQASKVIVGSIARQPVPTALLSTHISDVAKIMVDTNVGAVVVTRDYEPLGIITERDIIERVVLANKKPPGGCRSGNHYGAVANNRF